MSSESEDEPLALKVRSKSIVADSEDEASSPAATVKPARNDVTKIPEEAHEFSDGESEHEDDEEPASEESENESLPNSDDNASDSEEEIPLAKVVATKKRPPKKKKLVSDSDSDDAPLISKVAANKKKAVITHDSSEDSSDDIPLALKLAKKQRPAKKKNKRSAPSDTEDEVAPASKKAGKRAKKAAADKKKDAEDSPKKRRKKEEEEVEVYKWWENDEHDDSIKWSTLEHNGVLFPPDYKPHGVKMLYDGKPVTLSPEGEEVAGFFGQLLGTQYVENPVFCKNFFDDFLEVLAEHDPDCPIREFEKCDFSPMHKYFEEEKERRKQMTKEQKDVLKEERKQIEAKYGWAMIDGRREKIGNFRIEPPGLFRGRGDHPKTGKLKQRVPPEAITLNLSEGVPVPAPPQGHQWGGIVHDNSVAWLATWTENVNNNIKYVLFAANSSLKGISDYKKFEKARELKKHIDKIRETYTRELKDQMMVTRQRATAMWLIDRLALRAGNEKGEDEADTVGCCSLRYEHVELEEDVEDVPDPENPGQMKQIKKKMVVFDFLGKDSIRYYNRVEVDPLVWKNLKIFKRPPKKEGDPIFDRLTTSSLNKHLQGLMPGLTAKVFRTYNASITFQQELKQTPSDGTVAEKILAYNRANRQVAILCNHQRTVSKAHGAQMEKLAEKILSMKYERHLVKQQMLKLDPKLKKKRPELLEEESDFDEETLERKAKEHEEKELEKLEKKYERMCDKAKEEGKPLPKKPKLSETKREPTLDRLEKQLASLDSRIDHQKAMRVDKDENKTTALGTSKINYIDPRITAAWCKQFDVPVEKMFTKTLREKFKWAMDMEPDWIF